MGICDVSRFPGVSSATRRLVDYSCLLAPAFTDQRDSGRLTGCSKTNQLAGNSLRLEVRGNFSPAYFNAYGITPLLPFIYPSPTVIPMAAAP